MRALGPGIALWLALGVTACVQISDSGIWIEADPPARPDPRPPKQLAGESAPELDPTEHDGLLRARGFREAIYYYEPDELWYRKDGALWFQAFHWDGHWFPAAEVPEALRELPATSAAPGG